MEYVYTVCLQMFRTVFIYDYAITNQISEVL